MTNKILNREWKESSIHAVGDSPFAEITTCWKCDVEIDRTIEELDGVYGNKCPECGESLRNHPTYGEGNPQDLFQWHLTRGDF